MSRGGVAKKTLFLFLAICLLNPPITSSSEPMSRASATVGTTSEPLLDPVRVPEGIVIEYGSRYYWRDPATGKVFWAQKSFLQALFAQTSKSQASSLPAKAARPEPAAPAEKAPSQSASEAAADAAASLCRSDLRDLNGNELIKSAAQIESSIGVCGGARIADDLVITNGHCVIGPNGGWTQAKAARGKESNIKARFIVNGEAHTVRCGKVLAISPFQRSPGGRDFAILRCTGISGEVPIMRVTETEPLIHDAIAIATWDWPRRGVPSRVSVGRVLQNDHSYLAARLKVIDGNSGSMIVNGNQEICGVANGTGIGPATGAAFFHSMKEILRQVKEQSPETYAEIVEATHASPPKCVVPASYAAQQGQRNRS